MVWRVLLGTVACAGSLIACSSTTDGQSTAGNDDTTRATQVPTTEAPESPAPDARGDDGRPEWLANAIAAAPTDFEYLSWVDDPGGPLTNSPGEITFDSPSGNITCTWKTVEDGPLTCDITNRSTPPPPRPADCEEYLGWATSYVRLDAGGPVNGVCAGGVQAPYRGNVLPYGHALVAADYGCLSSEEGVRCVRLATGRGFFVSREQFTMF